MAGFLNSEDLEVYRKLCALHIEVCDLSSTWPAEEKYELGSQVRRSSNRSPAQLAEKHCDRHIRNRIEGVNRSRGEAAETIHHLYLATLKRYLDPKTVGTLKERYLECIRMLNGLERSPERHLPTTDQRWPAVGDDDVVGEAESGYGTGDSLGSESHQLVALEPCQLPEP